MKKLFSSLVLLLFVFSAVIAQDFKSAKRAFESYNMAPENNVGQLSTAIKGIDAAIKNEEQAAEAKVWLTRGKIYSAVGVEPLLSMQNPEAPEKALEAYKKVLTLTPKGFEKKQAQEGMKSTAPLIQNKAVALIQASDYAGAYKAFSTLLDLKTELNGMGITGVFQDEEVYSQVRYYTGLSAQLSGQEDAALGIYNKLYEEGNKNPELFKSLFNLTIKTDEEKAFKILEEGRAEISAKLKTLDRTDEAQEKEAKNLENNLTSLLFSEINYYLGKGQLDVLETKLKEAIAKEPSNVSLYSSLGKVYDDLYQERTEQGKTAEADDYYNKAYEYYAKALEIDENNLNATYNLGALYFNKSARLRKIMNETIDDNKYNVLMTEINTLYAKALPFFHKAEEIEPNNRETLYALKEIYAQKDELAKSKEYKERLEALKNK